jgi:YHS domain-containing protein
MTMITSTIDPISMNDVTDLENAPYVIEGEGDNALRIYFESKENKQEYLDIPIHGSDDMSGLKKIYDDMADNPNTGSIN